MNNIDARTLGKMNKALEEACGVFAHGGDHAVRKSVAERLKSIASSGNTSLEDLTSAAVSAVDDLRHREKAN